MSVPSGGDRNQVAVYVVVLSVVIAVLGGCSSESGDATPGGDASDSGGAEDAGDASEDAQGGGGIGSPCDLMSNVCGLGLACLTPADDRLLDPRGYCSKDCTEDDDCGEGAFCAEAATGDTPICLAVCDAETPTTCAQEGQLCSSNLFGLFELSQPGCYWGDEDAVDGSPCAHLGDCDAGQFCVINPFDFPGGQCTTLGCTPGDDSTCNADGDGICLPFQTRLNPCYDACETSSDCNDSFVCGSIAGLNVCLYPAQDVGDACETATDCGPEPWECLSGDAFPGGHCGALACSADDEWTCPSDAICYDPDSDTAGDDFCVAECGADGQCRQDEGYSCLPVGADGELGCRLEKVPKIHSTEGRR